MWQAPTYRKILIQNDWSYYVCPFRYLKKSQLSKHLWFSNTWTKNILEDSKGSFSKKKKNPFPYYPVSTIAASIEKHLEGGLKIPPSSSEKFLIFQRYSWHAPLCKQKNRVFQVPDPVSPILAEVPEQWDTESVSLSCTVNILLYTHYQQSKEEKNTSRWRWNSYQWCRKYLNSSCCITWLRSEVWTCISQP